MRPTSAFKQQGLIPQSREGKIQYLKEFLAEFIGTFILIAVGDSSIASYKLKGDKIDVFAVCFCFGLGALIGITASLPVSGAHINPSVTIAFASIGKFPWKKTIHYIIAQFLGGFVAAAAVYTTYYDGINSFDNGTHSAYDTETSTGMIFATYPAEYISLTGVLIDQIIGTGLLLFGIVAVIDEKGINTPKHLQPLIFSLIITAMCVAYTANCGAVFNPARDLPPRLFTSFAGWGIQPFKPLNGHYWWIGGIIGPTLGGLMGVWLYYITIEMYHENNNTTGQQFDSNSSLAEDHHHHHHHHVKDDRGIESSEATTTTAAKREQQEGSRIQLESIETK